MRKTLMYSICLILLLFIPAKTADMIINNDIKKNEEEKEWIIYPPKDTTPIEQVEKEEVVVDKKVPTVVAKNWWEYPDKIFTTKRSGDDLLVLVNKQYKLPSTYAPKDLVKSSTSGIRRGENYYLRTILIDDLTSLITDSKAVGIDLSIVSAYRSYKTQVDTYNYWLSQNDNNAAIVDTFSARPGHSQHQLGTVIDFSSNEIGDKLGDEFGSTNASKWLVENSYKYGFVISYPKGYESITGYKFESWHYRYIGKSYASEMINSGMILENYLTSKN